MIGPPGTDESLANRADKAGPRSVSSAPPLVSRTTFFKYINWEYRWYRAALRQSGGKEGVKNKQTTNYMKDLQNASMLKRTQV